MLLMTNEENLYIEDENHYLILHSRVVSACYRNRVGDDGLKKSMLPLRRGRNRVSHQTGHPYVRVMEKQVLIFVMVIDLGILSGVSVCLILCW